MRSNLKSFLFLIAVALSLNSCKGPEGSDKVFLPTKQQKAEDAVKSWMQNSKEYPYYKPVVFGDLSPRYEKTDRTIQLSIQITEEEALSQELGNTQKLDSLKNLLEQNKGNLLGYIIPHKFQETNLAGETLNRELLFFLDTSFRVASALTPESFDFILDEKVFFRPDSAEN